ncbi:MAG: hypothetical protein ACLUFV_02440 [Acutalibacteraceae bacterium]
MEQTLDGVRFCLRTPCRPAILSRYGRAFCVFDQNDSGNLSFAAGAGRRPNVVAISPACRPVMLPPNRRRRWRTRAAPRRSTRTSAIRT